MNFLLKFSKNIVARVICLVFIFFCIFAFVHSTHAASFFDQFIDPTDGKFDASDWLINAKGFLPVPIIITEPAVGYGAGAALLFFHAKTDEEYVKEIRQEIEERTEKRKASLPPSISGLVGLGTENGTWAAGGFHFGSWKQDKIRYTGGVVYPSVNLTFYGSCGSNNPILKDGLDYNLED